MLIFLIKFWKELVIASLLGLLMFTKILHQKEVSNLNQEIVIVQKKYDDLVKEYQSATIEYQQDIINKDRKYLDSTKKIEEKYKNEISNISIERTNLNGDINRLSERLKQLQTSSSKTNSNNTESTSSLSGGELSTVSDLLVVCSERYSDMGAEADRLKISIKSLQEHWSELQKTYNTPIDESTNTK